MTLNEKAVQNLKSKDLVAFEENSTVYVCVDGIILELAIFEIEYQAKEYDEKQLEL